MNEPKHPASEVRRIYTLGPPGTFSDLAAQRIRDWMLRTMPGIPAPPIQFANTLAEVLRFSQEDAQALGVAPIENSTTGTVLPVQDGLIKHELQAIYEVNLPVRLALMINASREDVVRIYAHPVAWEQCEALLAHAFPDAEPTFTRSNVEAGMKLLKHSLTDPWGAIVPLSFAEQHPQLLAESDAQGNPHNETRFLALRHRQAAPAPDFERRKTAVLLEPEADRPGMLYELLAVFNAHQINLCRLESRPALSHPWSYVFFVDFHNNANTSRALETLAQGAAHVHILGSFDQELSTPAAGA